jgi:hypothetical protein
LEKWDRSIKKDPGLYPDLSTFAKFDEYERSYVAIARLQGTSEVLDPTYGPDPSDADEVALFDRKNIYMNTVFSQTFKDPKAKQIYRLHTPNAQRIWQEVMNHARSSATAIVEADEIRQKIVNARFDKGKSAASFLTYFNKLFMDYHERTEPRAHFTDDMKISLLQASVTGCPELNSVKAQVDIQRRTFSCYFPGSPMPPLGYDAYFNLLYQAAVTYDTNRKHRSLGTNGNNRNVHFAEYDDYEPDYNINLTDMLNTYQDQEQDQEYDVNFSGTRANGNSASMPREAWNSLLT